MRRFVEPFLRKTGGCLIRYRRHGDNGKTTVTGMLRAICEEEGEKCGVIGTVGNSVGGAERETEVTTPSPRELYRLLAEMRQAGEKYVFMEASSHALAYEKLYPIKPRLGIFTNLTPEHLDFHKTMDAYAAAKAKLFESSEMALLNADSPFAGRMRAALPEGEGQCYLCSESSRNAHFMAQNIRESGDLGVEFDLIGENEAIHIRSDLPGQLYGDELSRSGGRRKTARLFLRGNRHGAAAVTGVRDAWSVWRCRARASAHTLTTPIRRTPCRRRFARCGAVLRGREG